MDNKNKTQEIDAEEIDEVREEYIYSIGLLSVRFQTLEDRYKVLYKPFLEEPYDDKGNVRFSFSYLVKQFEKKAQKKYKNDLHILNSILDIIKETKLLIKKRNYYIHSVIRLVSIGDKYFFYLYKKVKNNEFAHLQWETDYAGLNENEKSLSIDDIKKLSKDIEVNTCKFSSLGMDLGFKNKTITWDNINKLFDE